MTNKIHKVMAQRVQTQCRFLLGKNNNETDHKIILTTPYVSAVKCCKFMFLEFSKAKSKHLPSSPLVDAKTERKNNSCSIWAKNCQNRINLFQNVLVLIFKKEVRWLIEINEFRTSVEKLWSFFFFRNTVPKNFRA